MARLIDADELLSEYQTICSSIRCYDCQFNGEWGDKGCKLEALIKDAPTVDPVMHGEWIRDERFWHCSVCNECSSWAYKYCPHCGAKMKEELL